MPGFVLNPEQEDQFLDLMLPCKDDMEYQRCLVTFGHLFDRPAQLSLKEGENWLRRRSNCRSQYSGPAIGSVRANRSGLAFSFVEAKILYWAEHWQAEGTVEPTTWYLANLMQRSTKEVQAEIDRRQTTRNGMERLF